MAHHGCFEHSRYGKHLSVYGLPHYARADLAMGAVAS